MPTNSANGPERDTEHQPGGLTSDHPRYVLDLREINASQVAVVGGKAANLGELSRLDGTQVPAGFCITTDAFRRILAAAPSIDDRLGRLALLSPDDRESISTLSTETRDIIAAVAIPDDVAGEITDAIIRFGEHAAYAVRSSATAEDLPTASFAGQQDTYLNIVGPSAILDHVSRCWASLFTERAVVYRLRNGFDQRGVAMAVVVQQMIVADSAGILFTADPVTSNRRVATVDASFGLGEALVSGLVTPDVFRVRDDRIVETVIATKQREVIANAAGGTEQHIIDPARQHQPALSDEQVVRLVRLGRSIESHFGCPQDIEWCLVDDAFHIVQSRPITTLFPVPVVGDGGNHVFVSVGHQQMMTDPMKPLGLSLWQMTALRPMYEAGGRLFVDVSIALASRAMRAAVIEGLGTSDPLIGDALQTIVDRGDFVPLLPDDAAGGAGGTPAGNTPAPIETDPAIVADLMALNEASVAAVRDGIRDTSGPELIDFIVADVAELKRILFDPRSHQVFTAAIDASSWLNERLETWLGEKNVADVLTQSVPDNVTSEMGLALLDVADAIRPHPQVVEFLRQVTNDGFLAELTAIPGGQQAHDAIQAFLDRYGMRCVGEIDITRPRWSEQPTALVPLILGNVKNFEPGAGERRFERGRQQALAKRDELLERLRTLPDGESKARETADKIGCVRTFIGYREYPKYGIVCRYGIYKQALVEQAERLVAARVLESTEDIFFLTMAELAELVRTNHVDRELIRRRMAEFRSNQSLTPPRVLTSDGEVVAGVYRRNDLPATALVGLAVSGGTVEGRARVMLDLAQAELEPGDILVTAYTDPSWTPLFVAIAGLVTEVGGLMTHGAVIAREYGLPAVVGVEHATELIRDGQRIRINGTDGYVEILPPA